MLFLNIFYNLLIIYQNEKKTLLNIVSSNSNLKLYIHFFRYNHNHKFEHSNIDNLSGLMPSEACANTKYNEKYNNYKAEDSIQNKGQYIE